MAQQKPDLQHMYSGIDIREIVLDILIEHETKGTYSNVLIRNAQDRSASLSLPQRSFLKRLAEGTLERQIELDDVIDRHLRDPKIRVKTSVRCLLRMSIYQIYYMDSVTDYAACNEAVRLCRKRHLSDQAGFVNALLRTVCRDKEENLREGKDAPAPRPKPLRTRPSDATIVVARPKAAREGEGERSRSCLTAPEAGMHGTASRAGNRTRPSAGSHEGGEDSSKTSAASSDIAGAGSRKDLSLKYSVPAEILDLWRDQLGEERLDSLCRAMMEIRPVCIRFDSRLGAEEKESLIREWMAAGVGVQPGRWEENCRYLRHTSKLTELPGFREGLWTVQDESSQLTAQAAGLTGRRGDDIPKDAVILDLCAAPGGKSILAAMERPEGHIVSCDLSREKTDRIRANVRRMRLANVTVEENDASNLREDFIRSADLVLCDVPCSGLGVMTRKRDIKYNISPQKIRSLTALQKKIALNAAQMVRPGGVLLYSTCTINRPENEKIASEIVHRTDLIPDDLAPYLPEDFPGIDGNQVQLFPDIHGTDGFFMARFRRP